MKQHRPTELQCQGVLVAAAKRGGWLCHAERTSMTQSGRYSTAIQGDVGFPDLCLSHPTRGTVYWELKRKPNKPSAMQLEWLARLGGELVWVPDELDERVQWLVNA